MKAARSATLARGSRHPLSRAIAEAVPDGFASPLAGHPPEGGDRAPSKDTGFPLPRERPSWVPLVAGEVVEVAGHGLRGRIGVRELRLGHAEFALRDSQRDVVADDAVVLAEVLRRGLPRRSASA